MKVHYSHTPVHRLTACGLLTADMRDHITSKPSNITCKSCLRCLDGYIQRQVEAREATEHLSNEELFVMVVERLIAVWDCSYSTIAEATVQLTVLLSRLIDVGFITKPDEIDIDWYYD